MGVKFIISGRLKGKQRSDSKLIKVGKVPTQTFSKKVDFFTQSSHTMYGVFGLKFWIYKAKAKLKPKSGIMKEKSKNKYILKVKKNVIRTKKA
jgi:ribosomal protein S3